MLQTHEPVTGRERGTSLVLVLLVAIIAMGAVYATVTLTYDHFQRTKMARDSTYAALNAQEVFDCVRYWVNLNSDYFTDDPRVNDSGVYTYEVWTEETETTPSTYVSTETGYGTSSTCLQTRLDFINPTHGETYVSDGVDWATSTFTVGNLTTKVVRDLSTTSTFDGQIYVYSRTDQDQGPYLSERYQRHWYRVGIKGADVMFVIDRSGSIAGTRTSPATSKNEWRELMLAVTETVDRFDSTYNIRFGVTTFSTGDVTDMGKPVPPDADCANPAVSCLLEPDIPLTEVSSELPSAGLIHDNPIDDSWGAIRKGAGFTNISAGIASGAAELMGKYYPLGTASQWADFTAAGKEALIPGRASGWLEFAVSEGIDLESTLIDKPFIDNDHGDRTPDSGVGGFPDYIFLITDGEPNKVPASTSTSAGYPIDLSPVQPCFLASSTYPVDIGFTAIEYGVEGDLREKCNATILKRTLNTYGIQFGVIGVGVNATTEAWLSDTMSDLPYVRAATYRDLQQAISALFGGIALLEYR